MSVQLTTRKSLRWVPDEPSEPTSTLVFDIGTYFIDLRVNKHDSSIDWGMAGKKATLSEKPLKFQWTKEICSMGTEASDDIAEFEIFDNGDAFEKGEMPNPANGNKVQAFEEVWGDMPITSSEQPAWVLRRKDEDAITYIGRIADHYQVLRKDTKGNFMALREESVGGTWQPQYAIGGGNLPSIRALGEQAFDARSWSVGNDIEVDGRSYSVLAVEKI
ncbi:hypothetical protein AAFC00_000919 [Neodothiora populina]|uniref:Protein HRI1 n=1 Tax=Neodothiora populina TaxID=2781224 RepID=A0ABR3PM67_9PEZI